ncbi:MAG: Sir2 family NAD-dependent protein deacetylase [Chloroflexota bacterium]
MSLALSDDLVQRLRDAQSVVVLTGGGMAAESHVPSFRESHAGEWAKYDVHDLATHQGLVRNPRLVWEWYEYRRQLTAAKEPSLSHYALVDLEQYYPTFTLVTQTIDGLHWRAGSRDVVELNGCLLRSRCYDTGRILSEWEEVGEVPPRSPFSGGILRPDVVLFGEGLPQAELRRAQKAVEQCDLFLCVGSVAAIEPVSSFPFVAKRVKALTMTIDVGDSIYSLMADSVVLATPGEVLPELAQLIVGDSAERQVQ